MSEIIEGGSLPRRDKNPLAHHGVKWTRSRWMESFTDEQYNSEEERVKEAIMSKVWFITGAGSGIGAGIAKVAR